MNATRGMRRSTAVLALAGLSLITAVTRAQGVQVDVATKDQSDAAKKKFRAAKKAYDAQKLEDALQLFRDSYSIVKSPNSHLMIAKILAELGRNAEAYNELESVIAEATETKSPEKYAQTAEDARAQQQALTKKLGFVVVQSRSEVTIGGHVVPPARYNQRMPVEAGAHDVKLVDASGVARDEKIDVSPGATITLDVAPRNAGGGAAAPVVAPGCERPQGAPPQPQGIAPRTLGLVLGGVGLAGMGAFVGFGLASRSKLHTLESECPNGLCPSSLSDEARSGRTFKNLANVGFGVGVAGLAIGTVLILASPRKPSASPSAALVLGPQSVELKGAF